MSNKKMNIAILMSSLSCGGAERVAVSYANWLVNNTDNNVYILKFDCLPSAYELDEKVKVISLEEKLSSNRIKAVLQRYRFCKYNLKKMKASIVFAMFYQTQIYAYFSKPKHCILIGSERCNIRKRNFMGRIFSKLGAKRCKGFIFQTNGIKAMFPKKVRNKSVVIPNAISNQKLYEIKNVKKEKIITAMGRLTSQKGFDILIKAFSFVSKKHPDYKLIIFGEGEERNNLQSLIEKLKLQEKVSLPGVSNEAIKYVANSNIFVLSSRYEGMPNVLIEAMASGVACISTDCEFGPSDLITNNHNGILIPVDDITLLTEKINYLIENDNIREEIGKNAFDIRKTLNSDFIYHRYYDYFITIYTRYTKRNLTSKIQRVFKNPSKILQILIERGYFNWLSDDKYLKLKYRLKFHRGLNLKNPRTFNEKLQWLKLYDRNPNYTKMVDKYEVRDYIEKAIGKEYLIPLIGVYDKFDDIDFNKLPNQFVIKCNHDSGGLVVCKDKSKLDFENSRKKINQTLNVNYFYRGREWPYKNVKPRIIVEKYMEDKKYHELIDYKFMCFNGEPKIIFTCSERFSDDGLKVTFFDDEWNRLPFERHYPSSKKEISRPGNLDKMKELARILSKDIPFVRVDFYEINKKIYFGELTFYPGSGFEEFTPEEWDDKLGDMIQLPNKEDSYDL